MNPYLRKRVWERSTWRIAIFVCITILALLALFARLIQVQLVQGDAFRAAAQENQIRLIPVAAPRGKIVDRTGKAIVRSRPSFVVPVLITPSSALTAPVRLAGDVRSPRCGVTPFRRNCPAASSDLASPVTEWPAFINASATERPM